MNASHPQTRTFGIAALDEACRLMGSQDALARQLTIKSPSISGWRDRGKVPAERCLAIEQATAGQITRQDLRPDVFGESPTTNLREAG